ncbi:hypothetical protein RR46_07953, partial [Papilio xuthus]
LWHERCKKNSHVLNDCNWCWCDSTYQYRCSARVCGQVDMFGHFNDAIKEINVGMEGKGSWRSTESACVPGVYYRRGTVLCVCNEDGYWPNPVCRDIFRILHSVEVTRGIEVTQKCEPTKLYLISCNVCFCPSTGLLNLEFCTKLTCSNEDPVLNATTIEEKPETKEDVEVYATCNTTMVYSLGCQTCTCLRNNRLLCDNCTSVEKSNSNKTKNNETICENYEIGQIFYVECNLCFCDDNSSMYCTTRQCLKRFPIKAIQLSTFESSLTPVDDHECLPGTKYNRDCEICYCEKQNGVTTFSCTIKQCNPKPKMDLVVTDCVQGTIYERNCLICRCDILEVKRETCIIDTRCSRIRGDKEIHTHGLELLYGYCQPLHIYTNDCNICQCAVNGKLWKCTTHNCVKPAPVVVDLVPVLPEYPDPCPKGGSYKLDCNVCFCLDNGNAICTTNDCLKIEKNKDI